MSFFNRFKVIFDIKEYYDKARTNWFAYLAVCIVTSAFAGAFIFSNRLPLETFLEFEGALCVLAGTFWAFLGVVITRDEKQKFLAMKQNNAIDVETIINSMLSSSTFSAQGAMLIFIGTILLVTKMLMPFRNHLLNWLV